VHLWAASARTAAPRDDKRGPAKPSRGAAKLAVLSARRERAEATASGTTSIGVLAGVGKNGEVYLDLPAEQRRAVPARSIVPLDKQAVGRELLVAWPRATLQPVVIGFAVRRWRAQCQANATAAPPGIQRDDRWRTSRSDCRERDHAAL